MNDFFVFIAAVVTAFILYKIIVWGLKGIILMVWKLRNKTRRGK